MYFINSAVVYITVINTTVLLLVIRRPEVMLATYFSHRFYHFIIHLFVFHFLLSVNTHVDTNTML